MDRTTIEEKFAPYVKNQSASFKQRVDQAYGRQIQRQGCFNAEIPGYELFNSHSRMFQFRRDALELVKAISSKEEFSYRKTIRLARVARTVSDLRQKDRITPSCVKLATKYVTTPIPSLK